MQTPADYLARTESAARLLFTGIDSYVKLLSGLEVFVGSSSTRESIEREFEAWWAKRPDVRERNKQLTDKFMFEAVALDALCGAVLQIAMKPIEMFMPPVTPLPAKWQGLISVKRSSMLIGRDVKGVPLGLLIYAGRNQHAHFEDSQFKEPTPTVFNTIASVPGHSGLDQMFDLAHHKGKSLAANVTGLMGWRSYDSYIKDMNALLEVA